MHHVHCDLPNTPHIPSGWHSALRKADAVSSEIGLIGLIGLIRREHLEQCGACAVAFPQHMAHCMPCATTQYFRTLCPLELCVSFFKIHYSSIFYLHFPKNGIYYL